jgi:hypothetical protein
MKDYATILPERKRIDSRENCRVSVRLTMHLESKDKAIKKELNKIWADLEEDDSVEAILKLIQRTSGAAGEGCSRGQA